MDRFGIDKPDLRFGMELTELTPIFADTGFNAFKAASIKGIKVPGAAAEYGRNKLDGLTDRAKSLGAKGLVWLKVDDGGTTFTSPVAKFLSDDEVAGVIEAFGAEPIGFLSTRGWSLFSVGVATIWWCIGLPMILLLAALQQIPADLYEAAALDNASKRRVLTRITLPSIKGTIMLVAVIQIVMQFQLFGQALLMTNGGPAGTSRPIVMYIYETAFVRWDVGMGAAASECSSSSSCAPRCSSTGSPRGPRGAEQWHGTLASHPKHSPRTARSTGSPQPSPRSCWRRCSGSSGSRSSRTKS